VEYGVIYWRNRKSQEEDLHSR